MLWLDVKRTSERRENPKSVVEIRKSREKFRFRVRESAMWWLDVKGTFERCEIKTWRLRNWEKEPDFWSLGPVIFS